MSFIQNLFTSRDNNSNSETYVGQQDRLWWDPVTNRFYYSDGITPGGFPVGGGGSGGNSISSGSTSVAIPAENGNVAITVNGVANTVVFATGNTTFAGNLLPTTANTYTLGTVGQPWKSLYVSGNTIYIDNNALSADGPNLFWNSSQVVAATANGTIDAVAVSATGNVTGDYFIGDGSQLTGLPAGYSNAEVSTYLASGTNSANIITSANVSGNYILGNGSQLTGLPATYGNANVAAYLPTYTGNLVSLTGNVTTTANISGAYLIGNGSQLTGVTAAAANIFNTVVANGTPLVADSPNGTVTLASGNNIIITGDAASDTATFAVSDSPVFSGNVTADYFVGNFGGHVMADRGADPSNWNTMTEMGVYTVNRTSWSGTVGTPLDSQVFVGLVEVKNSTDTALAQIFYPGTVENGNVKIQWNRTYWNGTWSSWIKIVNDEQVVIGGEF